MAVRIRSLGHKYRDRIIYKKGKVVTSVGPNNRSSHLFRVSFKANISIDNVFGYQLSIKINYNNRLYQRFKETTISSNTLHTSSLKDVATEF